MNISKIHIYTGFYDKLAVLLQSKLPNVQIINVPLYGPYQPYVPRDLPSEELELLKDAEVLISDEPLMIPVLDKLPNLKFAQGTWAGVAKLAEHFENKSPPTFPICRTIDEIRISQMVEYVIARIWAHERRWDDLLVETRKPNPDFWTLKKKYLKCRTSVDLSIGVLGVGAIGKEICRSLKFFGSKIIGLTRNIPNEENRCPYVDEYWAVKDLEIFVSKCDYLIGILPSTPETGGLLGGSVLSAAKKKPVLMNLGRGDLLSSDDIINALDNEWISFAYLDVFDEEPLPPDNPLWQHPKVILTPHVSGPGSQESIVQEILKNFNKFINNEKLLNQIDFNSGY